MKSFRLLACVLIVLPVFCGDALAVDEPVRSRWIAYTAFEAEDPEQTQRLSTGRAIDLQHPDLADWARDVAPKADRLTLNDFTVWLRVVRLYGVTEGEPVVMRAAKKLMGKTDKPGDIHRDVFLTAAMVATPDSRSDLKRLLKGRLFSKRAASASQEPWLKLMIAAALVRMGDESGRDYLVSAMRDYLDALPKAADTTGVPTALTQLADHRLLEQVIGLKENPRYQQGPASEVIDKVEHAMRLNAKPLEELVAIAKYGSTAPREDRLQAMRAIGGLGGKEEYKMISAIPNFPEGSDTRDETVKQTKGVVKLMLTCRNWRQNNE